MAERNEGPDFDNEGQVKQLFSEIDDVKASDELKISTLDYIFSVQDAGSDEDSAEGSEDEAIDQGLESRPIDFSVVREQMGGTSSRGKRGHRNRKAKMRILLLAACLAAFGVGGIAYASPVSHVSVGYGGKVITVDVNILGRTVSVYGDSAKSMRAVAGLELANKDYRESVQEVVGALVEEAPKRKSKPARIEIKIDSMFDSSRDALQEGVKSALAGDEEKESKGAIDPYFVDEDWDAQEPASGSDDEKNSGDEPEPTDDPDNPEEELENENSEGGLEEGEGTDAPEAEDPVVSEGSDKEVTGGRDTLQDVANGDDFSIAATKTNQ